MQPLQQQYAPYLQQQPHRVKFGWIGEAWNIYRRNCAPWLVLYLVVAGPVLLSLVGFGICIHGTGSSDSSSGGSSGSDPTGLDLAGLMSMFFGFFLSVIFLGVGVICSSTGIAQRQVYREVLTPSDIFTGMSRWIPVLLFLLMLLPTLLIAALVIGLGFFVACGLLMPAFSLVAGGESAGKAYSKSIAAMKGDWLRAGLFCLVFGLMATIVSALTIGLAAAVFVPMAYIISSLAQRDMFATVPTFDFASQPASGPEVWPPPISPLQPNVSPQPAPYYPPPPAGQPYYPPPAVSQACYPPSSAGQSYFAPPQVGQPYYAPSPVGQTYPQNAPAESFIPPPAEDSTPQNPNGGNGY